jgi:4-hydroxy-4-methyl-2-oxoglutarate aldolase
LVEPLAVSDLVTALAGSTLVAPRLLGPFEHARLDLRCAGTAVTVRGSGGDNLAIYHGLNAAPRGSVLVVALGGSSAAGHWGSLLTQAALRRGLAGVVIDGSVRDTVELAELGLPIFFRGRCPVKAGKSDRGEVGTSVIVDGVEISTGDLVVADSDGVLVHEASALSALLEAGAEIVEREAEIQACIEAGAALGEAFGLPDLD